MKKALFPILFIGVVFVSAAQKPKANFTVPAIKFQAPVSVAFTNTSMKADTYEWDFGDSTKSKEVNPIHRYKHSGNYAVILKVCKRL